MAGKRCAETTQCARLWVRGVCSVRRACAPVTLSEIDHVRAAGGGGGGVARGTTFPPFQNFPYFCRRLPVHRLETSLRITTYIPALAPPETQTTPTPNNRKAVSEPGAEEMVEHERKIHIDIFFSIFHPAIVIHSLHAHVSACRVRVTVNSTRAASACELCCQPFAPRRSVSNCTTPPHPHHPPSPV